jgi:hypothetical protein
MVRDARGVTHSDSRSSMLAHHEKHVTMLFDKHEGGELTGEQQRYLLDFAWLNRVADSSASENERQGAVYREYMRRCAGESPHDDEAVLSHECVCQCGATQLYDQREQLLVCTSCGVCTHDYSVAMPQHGTEESSVVPHFTYKKVNHFREWLAQCQARELSDITPTIEALQAELRKQRLSDYEQKQLTPVKVRAYLRQLRLGNYDHLHLIHSVVTGRRPPQFDHETEMRLVEMFKATLVPFETVRSRVCPTRSNFLSYSYVLRKLTGILGVECIDDHYFPLLKSREKLYMADLIWKAICGELGWTFQKSM